MNYTVKEITSIINGNLISEEENYEINNVSTDSRSFQNSSTSIFFALVTENNDGHDYISSAIEKGIKTFVVSKKINFKGINQIIVKDTLASLQLFAQKHRENYNIPVIGITGSYGKTIIKEWLYQLLNENYIICRNPKSYNSQLGVPLSVLELNSTHNLAIFEAGISQRGEMKNLEKIIQPTIGVLTKMGEAHQSGFKNESEKRQEKNILFESSNTVIELNNHTSNFNIPFEDKASIENCKLCIQVLQYLNIDNNTIQNRINKLTSLSLRMELIEGKYNSTLLNDSYNISLSSLSISLDYLHQQTNNKSKTIIISDIPETKFDSPEFIELLNKNYINKIITVGEDKIKNTNSFEIISFETTDELLNNINLIDFSNQFILIKGSRKYGLEKITAVLEEKKHQTVLEINLKQLSDNLKIYKNILEPETKIMVMVKAFAYGSGVHEIPKFLENKEINYFGTANTDEGVILRKNGVKTPIIVMNPEPKSFKELINYNLEPEIYSLELLDRFIRELILLNKKEYPIHLKIETGMNRLGFVESKIKHLISLVKSQPEVYIKSIFSHLSCADDLNEKEFTLNQINTFKKISNSIQKEFSYSIDKHILNSAGIENYPEAQFDMVRLGIGLYGINTSKNKIKTIPVSTLKSIIIQTKKIKKGESVSYGRSFIAEKDTEIGIIPIGYADGLRRSLGNGIYSFFINKTQVPIIGNICMDICIVDITGLNLNSGDSIEIFGKNNTIENMAKAMDTIPYEILTSVSQRVKRVFFED